MGREKQIRDLGQEVIDLLVEKNKAYGSSALEPLGIFAQGTAVDNLCARIDDKLARIKNRGLNDNTEDTLKDLIGYLILLHIANHEQRENNGGASDSVSNDIQEGRTSNKNSGVRSVSYPEWEERIHY